MNYIALMSDLNIPRNIIFSAVRTILVWIDVIIYSIVSLFFNLILQIANIDQLSVFADLYSKIQNRIYVIIGILMIFKVTTSLLTYLANPEKLNDKQDGGGKLVTRIVTSLILLVLVPTLVFPLLSEIQIPIVNTVGKIITHNVTVVDADSAGRNGTIVATTLMSIFFHLNDNCETATMGTGEVSQDDVTIDSIIEYPSKASQACSEDNKDMYLYTYTPFVSLNVAVVALIMLVIIGINIAIRAFKLIVLKILAPIPIISYIDPKSAKDGMLASYTKLFVKTYLDLFIQFGVYYLVLVLIGELGNYANYASLVKDAVSGVVSGTTIIDPTGISYILIFIGLLVFAFMAPKFIKKALNIKDSEFGTGLAGILSTGALIAGTAGATVNGVATSAAAGGGLLKNVGAGIAGAIGGLSAGAKAGFGSGKTDYSKIQSAITARNARIRSDADAGVNFGTRISNWAGETFMGRSPFDAAKSKVEALDAFTNYYASLDDALGKEAAKGKYGAVSFNDKVYNGRYSGIVGKSVEFSGAARAAEAAGQTEFDYNGTKVDLAHASYIESELKKSEKANLYQSIMNYDNLDPTARSAIDKIPDIKASVDNLEKEFDRSGAASIAGVGNFAAFSDKLTEVDDRVKMVKAESTRIKNSTEYVAAAAAAKKK